MATYRITAFGHLSTLEIFQFTLHTSAVSGSAAAMAVTAAEAVTLLWNGPPTPASSIKQLVPAAVGVDGVEVNELNSVGRNVAQSVQTLALVGTNASEPLPPQNSVAVSTRTASPTRAGRGRFFLPPYGVDQVAGMKLLSAARSSTAAAAKAALDHLNAGGWQVIIFHRFDPTLTPVTAIDVGDVFDSQRRRRNQLTETRLRLALA